MREEDFFSNTLGLCRVLNVLPDGFAIRDATDAGPLVPSKSVPAHVAVAAEAGILPEGPCPAHHIPGLEDDVAEVRELLFQTVRRVDPRDPGPDDDGIDARARAARGPVHVGKERRESKGWALLCKTSKVGDPEIPRLEHKLGVFGNSRSVRRRKILFKAPRMNGLHNPLNTMEL